MLAIYAVLDGFDLGIGVIHLFLSPTTMTAGAALTAVGPFWDGNEVWLLLAAVALYSAFPAVYASRDFCLAGVVLVWLLILRGFAMEFRNRVTTLRGGVCSMFLSASAVPYSQYL